MQNALSTCSKRISYRIPYVIPYKLPPTYLLYTRLKTLWPMAYLYQLYISYKISYRTPREASYRLPIEYLMTYVICSGFMKGTLTSWALGFSHITRPLNGLGFTEGILQCWAQYFFLTKALMGSVSVCRLILGSGLLHVAPLISHTRP